MRAKLCAVCALTMLMLTFASCSGGIADAPDEQTSAAQTSAAQTLSDETEAETTAVETEEEALTYTDPESIALDCADNLEAAAAAVYEEYRASAAGREGELEKGAATIGSDTMKLDMDIIGEPDENGYPLIIALHGGGQSDTPDMNDGQWEQMKLYYKSAVKNGIYIAVRGLRDTWNTHFVDASYAFYDRIIEDAVAFYNVDPNRVYLMGFSAGGDGVYAISPRMADRFAAVNMSAGHPNGVSLVNLYNLPIFLQVGEKDDAYQRNTTTALYDAMLGKYAGKYGGGYIHSTFIHIGKPHNFYDNASGEQTVVADVAAWKKTGDGGSMKTDTNAVRLTGAYTRDPLPARVVWETSMNAASRNIPSFYWLSDGGALSDGIIVASYDGGANTVTVESCTSASGTLRVYLSQDMLDLFAPVTVDFCGVISEVTAVPSLEVMRATAAERGDPDLIFAAYIDIDAASGEIK